MKAIGCFFLLLVLLPGKACPINNSSDSCIHSSFVYMDVGVTLPVVPVPSIGLGYRFQEGHTGGDFSLHSASVGALSQVKGAVLYHYYFNPNNDSQFYLGSGLGISWVSYHIFGANTDFCLSPELACGKQFKTDSGTTRFWQFQISVPTYSLQHSDFFTGGKLCQGRWFLLPIVAFYYGFCF